MAHASQSRAIHALGAFSATTPEVSTPCSSDSALLLSSETMARRTVCVESRTYGSVGALGEGSPRATQPFLFPSNWWPHSDFLEPHLKRAAGKWKARAPCRRTRKENERRIGRSVCSRSCPGAPERKATLPGSYGKICGRTLTDSCPYPAGERPGEGVS